MSTDSLPVTYADIEAAARVFFKCENLQRVQVPRRVQRAVAVAAEFERRRGVLAYSSGNHAQAVALAGREPGIPATMVMPEDAPAVKREARENSEERGRQLAGTGAVVGVPRARQWPGTAPTPALRAKKSQPIRVGISNGGAASLTFIAPRRMDAQSA